VKEKIWVGLKFQIPSTKFQINSKFQFPKQKLLATVFSSFGSFGNWNLEFGYCLFFGIWDLEF
jgi:hypothetical protein